MAFILHCGRRQFDQASCDRLIGEWRTLNLGDGQPLARRALDRLRTEPEERLALLGLTNDASVRSWLVAPDISPSLCLSLLALEQIEVIAPLPVSIWAMLDQDGAAFGFSRRFSNRLSRGSALAKWLGALSGVALSAQEPNASLLGGWSRGATLHKALPHLLPPGADPAHDAMRRWLEQFDESDWIFVNSVW